MKLIKNQQKGEYDIRFPFKKCIYISAIDADENNVNIGVKIWGIDGRDEKYLRGFWQTSVDSYREFYSLENKVNIGIKIRRGGFMMQWKLVGKIWTKLGR